jgi:hypothetical protein
MTTTLTGFHHIHHVPRVVEDIIGSHAIGRINGEETLYEISHLTSDPLPGLYFPNTAILVSDELARIVIRLVPGCI